MYLVYTHIFFYSGDFGISKVMSTRGKEAHTGKSLSEVLLFAEHGENMLCTKIVLNVRNDFCTQYVLPRFELGIFMYLHIELIIQWTICCDILR